MQTVDWFWVTETILPSYVFRERINISVPSDHQSFGTLHSFYSRQFPWAHDMAPQDWSSVNGIDVCTAQMGRDTVVSLSCHRPWPRNMKPAFGDSFSFSWSSLAGPTLPWNLHEAHVDATVDILRGTGEFPDASCDLWEFRNGSSGYETAILSSTGSHTYEVGKYVCARSTLAFHWWNYRRINERGSVRDLHCPFHARNDNPFPQDKIL